MQVSEGTEGGEVSEEGQELTDKQRVFVEHYLTCWNATEAARRAGYEGNDNTLGVVGYENLRKPKIADLVEQRISEIAMGADEVLLRLAEQARADVGDFIKIDGRGKVSLDLKRAQREGKLRLVKKLTPTQFGMKLELHDAQAALVHLGKHHGLFKGDEEDWRAALAKAGLDASELFRDLVGQLATAFGPPSPTDAGGGSSSSPSDS